LIKISSNILEEITELTFKGNYKEIGKLVRKAKRQGYSPEDIVKALSAGITSVSRKYKKEGMYLDDIVVSAAAFEVGVRSLPPMPEEEKSP